MTVSRKKRYTPYDLSNITVLGCIAARQTTDSEFTTFYIHQGSINFSAAPKIGPSDESTEVDLRGCVKSGGSHIKRPASHLQIKLKKKRWSRRGRHNRDRQFLSPRGTGQKIGPILAIEEEAYADLMLEKRQQAYAELDY